MPFSCTFTTTTSSTITETSELGGDASFLVPLLTSRISGEGRRNPPSCVLGALQLLGSCLVWSLCYVCTSVAACQLLLLEFECRINAITSEPKCPGVFSCVAADLVGGGEQVEDLNHAVYTGRCVTLNRACWLYPRERCPWNVQARSRCSRRGCSRGSFPEPFPVQAKAAAHSVLVRSSCSSCYRGMSFCFDARPYGNV